MSLYPSPTVKPGAEATPRPVSPPLQPLASTSYPNFPKTSTGAAKILLGTSRQVRSLASFTLSLPVSSFPSLSHMSTFTIFAGYAGV